MGEDKQSDGNGSGAGWEHRLNQSGLGGLIFSIIHAMRPVAPVAASLLWIVQPAAAVFDREDEVEALANWLNDPDAGLNQMPFGRE